MAAANDPYEGSSPGSVQFGKKIDKIGQGGSVCIKNVNMSGIETLYGVPKPTIGSNFTLTTMWKVHRSSPFRHQAMVFRWTAPIAS
jgi:hypothetical protein